MEDDLINALVDFFTHSGENHVEIDFQDITDYLGVYGIDLSLYSIDELREAIDAAMSATSGSHSGGTLELSGHELAFQGAYNDGTYHWTNETVHVENTLGIDKGDFHVYNHNGSKYIDFLDTWVKVEKYHYFILKGNRYYMD